MKTKYIFILFISLLFVSSCNDFLEVVPVSKITEKEVFTDISRAQTFLNPAYAGVRYRPWISMDSYTDNAVNNDGSERAAVSGSTEESSPVEGEWSTPIRWILHINEFLEKGFDVPYDAFEEETSMALQKRIRGEAYGLRAYYKWILLKNFAGPSANDPGVMLGIPLFDNVITLEEANSIARSTYMESFNNILEDLDSAMVNVDILRYEGKGDFDGVKFTGRISGEMIYALKARMALFASSAAFNQISKEEAANIIYNSIVAIDGEALVDLQPFGDFDKVDNPDNLWRVRFENTGWYESNYYPPSLFGKGICNPSQNLVDAFPDIFGYPITHSASVYDPANPYEMRDPRFERFIFHNGLNEYPDSAVIEVFDGGKDAIGGYTKRATRTGYYMKKFLNENINLNPDESGSRSAYRTYPIFSRGALYLDFAEAAVAAYGVAGKSPEMMFSAKEALIKVRSRGGLVLDDYIEFAANDLNQLTELIQNERRIEFAFEGERYYDVRRWKLPVNELNVSVKGINVERTGEDQYIYATKEVENRNFQDYMYYNPIPREEILRSEALVQNFGWNN